VGNINGYYTRKSCHGSQNTRKHAVGPGFPEVVLHVIHKRKWLVRHQQTSLVPVTPKEGAAPVILSPKTTWAPTDRQKKWGLGVLIVTQRLLASQGTPHELVQGVLIVENVAYLFLRAFVELRMGFVSC
jgi:hypothetical protein